MSEVAVRRLSAATRHDYCKVRLEALHSAPEALGSTYELDARRPIEAFEERLASSVVLGAYRGGKIVGMVGSLATRAEALVNVWDELGLPRDRRAQAAA